MITPERFQVLGVLKCPLKTDRLRVLGEDGLFSL